MKVLIVSDTHRKDDNLERIIEEEAPFDMLIHLGDAEGSEYLIEDWVDKDCQLEMVKGNNDFFSVHELSSYFPSNYNNVHYTKFKDKIQ